MVPRTSLKRVTYALKTTVVLSSIRAAFYATSTVADASVYASINNNKPASQQCKSVHHLPKLAGKTGLAHCASEREINFTERFMLE